MPIARLTVLALLFSGVAVAGHDAGVRPLPARLSDTGLYIPGSRTVPPGIVRYAPQYPLWSDGATKRRWLYLPPGTSIDGSRSDAWVFPRGTRLWKEFAHDKRVETRLIEHLHDGTWRYATYVWDEDGQEARLAPEDGIPDHAASGAPGGRYTIPSQSDCRACHEGAAVPVLGISAIQLSPDRDLLAPHAEPADAQNLDLRRFVLRGLLSGFPVELLSTPPRIAAASPVARAALGYLHANCGHCHNASGPMLAVDMVLTQGVSTELDDVLRSLVAYPGEKAINGLDTRVVPGHPEQSLLAFRMRSRNPFLQMPPLGTTVADAEATALIERWIREELNPLQEYQP